MPKSLLFVESRPASPDHVDEYHRWHDQVHVPEMLAVDGFVSARRWHTDGESFVTLYEIDTDVDTARQTCERPWTEDGCSNPSRSTWNRRRSCAT